MDGRLFVISGPSGAGKSTLIRRLRGLVTDLGYSVSHTSRAPRKGEEEGVHYHFVGEETFRKMIEEEAFVEWAMVYRDYYGTSFSGLREGIGRGLDVVMDVDSQGARNIRRHFGESILIYVLPPSLMELERRLRGRGTEDEEVILARFEKALSDIQNCTWYDYILFNDDLEEAARELKSIVVSERCRRPGRLSLVEKTFNLSLQE